MTCTRSTAGVFPLVEDEIPTITYDDLAKRTGLTTRTLRAYVAQGAMPPPAFVYVSGTFIARRMWSESIVAKAERIAAERRAR